MSTPNPGPRALLIGHAVVGAAGAAALHLACRPKTIGDKIAVWILGAAAAIVLHHYMDARVARMLTETFPGIG
jgi:hypothetical protein